MNLKTILISAILSTMAVSTVTADVPQVIAYQGSLADASGDPVVDGPYLIRLRLYDDPIGGNTLWDSGIRQIEVASGLFAYNIGDTTTIPDNLFKNDTSLWLGVKVGADPEMTPRTKLTSVGFAYQALRADSVDWSGLGNVPAGFADGSDDVDTDWNNLLNVPAGFADGTDDGTTDASTITTGTLADTILSGNVPLLNATNVFTGGGGMNWFEGGIAAVDNSIVMRRNSFPRWSLREGGSTGFRIVQDYNDSDGLLDLTRFEIDDIGNFDLNGGNFTFGGGDFYVNGELLVADNDIALRRNSAHRWTLRETASTGFQIKQVYNDADVVQNKIRFEITDDGMVKIGDSTLTADNNGIRIGDGGAPEFDKLIRAERDYNTGNFSYGHYMNVDNSSSGLLYGYYVLLGSTSSGGSGKRYGVYVNTDNSLASSSSQYGGYFSVGSSSKTNGNSYGVYATSAAGAGSTAYGIYASKIGASGAGYAGYFSGNVSVTGTLSKGGGSFKIDHPLDPENKYLSHSFVESPDMMNVYNGNVVLDGNGSAVVDLPDYFDALNRDFRYQLTCIGGFAPIYIADKIHENRFVIAGGNPGLEVSWQVTGVRQDRFANSNRIQVEVDKKPKERGLYIHPEAYNLDPMEKSINREQLLESEDQEDVADAQK